MATEQGDGELVLAARDGDRSAFTGLFERWFDRCFDVSWRILHDRELAAEVAQDTMLVAWQRLGELRDPEAFGGWVLRTARNRSLNRLEREGRSRAVGAEEAVAMTDAVRSERDVADDVTDAARDDLVWAASAALGERDASVLDLHLRHGLTAGELGEALEVTTNNAHQLVHRLKKRLGTAVRAWVLWRGGQPRCEELAGDLATAGITSFGPDAVTAIDRHARSCVRCEDDRTLALAPEAMFAAVPLVPVGMVVRARAASALEAQGVPIDLAALSRPAGTDVDPDASAQMMPTDAAPRPRARDRARAASWALAAAIVLLGGLAGWWAARGADELPVTVAASPEPSPEPTADPRPPDTRRPTTTSTVASTTTTVLLPPIEAPPPPLPAPTPILPSPTTTGVLRPPPPPPTTTTSTTPPPVAPTVVSFDATYAGFAVAPCATFESAYDLDWVTSDADQVTLAGPGAPSGARPATGGTRVCIPTSSIPSWTLTATGPGGSTQAQASG